MKALSEVGINPSFIAGTSAGSLIGALLAAGIEWSEIAALAQSNSPLPGLVLPDTFGFGGYLNVAGAFTLKRNAAGVRASIEATLRRSGTP